MRCAWGQILGFAVMLALVFTTIVSAAAPMTLLLDRTSGGRSITLSATTKRLHGKVWLYLADRSEAAHAKATLSCQTKRPQGTTFTIQWFKFEIKAGFHQEVWRHTDNAPCAISVTLTGRGQLSGGLRGF